MMQPRMTGFSNFLILAAMNEEANAAREVLGSYPSTRKIMGKRLPVECESYRVEGVGIHLVRSGVGPVNTSIALATVFENEEIEAVILLGVGGALVADLGIGDLVLSRHVVQHDSLSSLEAGDFRMIPGTLVLSREQGRAANPRIPADDRLLEEFVSSLSKGSTRVGTVISGNEFVGTASRKAALARIDSDALLVDMEAAGVAQVCQLAGVPFIVAKTVADRLNPDGSIESDFSVCLESAARNAATLVHQVISRHVRR